MLLTRSPLTWLRRASSVRLACVRRAASVHPEPGSNSLNNLYVKPSPAYHLTRNAISGFLVLLVCTLVHLTRVLHFLCDIV